MSWQIQNNQKTRPVPSRIAGFRFDCSCDSWKSAGAGNRVLVLVLVPKTKYKIKVKGSNCVRNVKSGLNMIAALSPQRPQQQKPRKFDRMQIAQGSWDSNWLSGSGLGVRLQGSGSGYGHSYGSWGWCWGWGMQLFCRFWRAITQVKSRKTLQPKSQPAPPPAWKVNLTAESARCRREEVHRQLTGAMAKAVPTDSIRFQSIQGFGQKSLILISIIIAAYNRR